MKNTSPLITLSLLSLLACAVLANGTSQTVSASKGGSAFAINGNNNTIDLSPQALKQLTKENSKILALLTTLNAKQQHPSERENPLIQENQQLKTQREQLAQENQQLKAQREQLAQQLALATANLNPAATQAVQGLEHGNLQPTAKYLRAIAQKARSEGVQKNAQAAQAMRQLASISTTTEALDALQSACDYEPNNALNWSLLGDMHLQAGNIARAEQAYRTMLQLTQTATHADPKDLDAQRDLSVSYNKIGDIQKAQGDLTWALASYRAGLAIAQTLAQKDKENSQAQRDLSVSYERIGDIQQAQGDLSGALDYFYQGLAIMERLTKLDESHVQWQQDVAEYLLDISNTKRAQGDQHEAKTSLKRAEAILDKLVREGKLSANRKIWDQDLRTKLEKAQSY
jgi:tetratricopeptide (TPR) repeat protein